MVKSIRQVGHTIRELRKSQKMTGEELGRRAGISQSKISKIESGFYERLHHDEIKKILNILNVPSTISQQLLSTVYEIAHKESLAASFSSIHSILPDIETERRTRLIRIYTANAIPALLQTTDYRVASLRYKGIEESRITACVKNTAARQDLLWDGKHSFHMIIPETVLYTMPTKKNEHLIQLDRLERTVSMPSVKLGIIPVEAGTILVEYTSFALYDDHTLTQAIARYEITSQDKHDIELHSDIFVSLERLASYDEKAIRLIRNAMSRIA